MKKRREYNIVKGYKMQITINSEIIKSQAKLLKDFLSEGGNEIKLGSCYQAISIMNGFKDWNQFSAFLKSQDEAVK